MLQNSCIPSNLPLTVTSSPLREQMSKDAHAYKTALIVYHHIWSWRHTAVFLQWSFWWFKYNIYKCQSRYIVWASLSSKWIRHVGKTKTLEECCHKIELIKMLPSTRWILNVQTVLKYCMLEKRGSLQYTFSMMRCCRDEPEAGIIH